MEREIVIRSNINPLINWLEDKRKEREERERIEREARWAKEKEERERKAAEWRSAHPILDKYTYISEFNYDYHSYQGTYVDYHFYEWSNIHCNPIHFEYSIPFYRFLDECKINLTDEGNQKLKDNRTCHIICKPGCNDLLIDTTYSGLVSQLNDLEVAKKVIASVGV